MSRRKQEAAVIRQAALEHLNHLTAKTLDQVFAKRAKQGVSRTGASLMDEEKQTPQLSLARRVVAARAVQGSVGPERAHQMVVEIEGEAQRSADA